MRKSIGVLVAVLAVSAGSAKAGFNVIDLTTAGATSGVVASNGNNVNFIVTQINPQSTGTGVIDPFVRVQANGGEQGYNTDLTPQFDTKAGTWTHAITLGAIPVVTIDGVQYRQFMLDINQNSGGNNELLRLNQIQIFTQSGDSLHTSISNASNTTQAIVGFSGATEVFRLNGLNDPNKYILMDYSLNHGSGSGDMFLYVKNDAFGSDNSKNLILFSQFGNPPGTSGDSNDGFEEWAVLQGPGTAVPVPPTVLMAAFGLVPFAGVAGIRRLRRKAA